MNIRFRSTTRSPGGCLIFFSGIILALAAPQVLFALLVAWLLDILVIE